MADAALAHRTPDPKPGTDPVQSTAVEWPAQGAAKNPCAALKHDPLFGCGHDVPSSLKVTIGDAE